MKKFATLIIISLLILIATSCTKEKKPVFDGVNCTGNCYILTGNLIDSVNMSGIQNGEVKFYFNDITGTLHTEKIFLGRALTDIDGTYTFRFDGSSFNNIAGYYSAEAYKDNMFSDPLYQNRVATFDLDSTLYNIPFIQNFPLFRPATLKVRMIVSTVTNFQFLTLDYSYGKMSNGIILNGGRPFDTIITWKTAGDLRTFIQADAKGNGVDIVKSDTVIINANGTKQVEIRF